jgi:hypothetical protein
MKQREMLGPFCSAVTILGVTSSAHSRIIDQACARASIREVCCSVTQRCTARAQRCVPIAALLCFLIFMNPDYQKSVTYGSTNNTADTPKMERITIVTHKVYYLKHQSKNKKKIRHVSNSLVSIYRWISIYRGLEKSNKNQFKPGIFGIV